MILQQLGLSYGHLRQMQSMQKAVQLTTVNTIRKHGSTGAKAPVN